jgi:hypothetical protein
MNAPRLTDAQVSQVLRAGLPDGAQDGLRERILEAAETTRQQRALPWFFGALSEADPVTRRRSLLIAAALLVALALAATAAVGALRLFERDPFRELSLEPPTVPSPAVTMLPRPSSEPPAPSAQVADRYQALVVRRDAEGTKIVAVRGDRQERVIASFPATERQEAGFKLVSEDGWLVMFYRDGTEFIDLRDPSRPPRPFFMGENTTDFSWHPDGRFAAWDASGVGTLIDPETGEATPFTLRGPVGNFAGWAADGSALVAYSDGADGVYAQGEPVPDAGWRVIRLDGGPDEAAFPDLYPGPVSFGRFGRYGGYGGGGARLQLCDPPQVDTSASGDGPRDCPDVPIGAVVGKAPDGKVTIWYGDELAPDSVHDASFGGDGTGMWLVLDRRVGGRQFVVARVDAPGAARVVAAAGLPTPEFDPFEISGVAPDDSLIAIRLTGGRGSGDAPDLFLVEPSTGRVTPVDGGFLGFIPSAAADTWAGEPFRAVEPSASLQPVLPAYPTLPSIDDYLVANQLTPGDRELWRQEYVAVEGSAGAPSTSEIGPLDLETGFGIVLVCSGPSDVLVTMEPDGPFMPLRSSCDSGESTGGQAPGWSGNVSARFVVTANTDTSWQLVIFDPAPE